MEEIHQAASAYYANLPDREKQRVKATFQDMDKNGDGIVSQDECMRFLREKGFGKLANPRFFEELDRDGNGSLDYEEAITVYYMYKTRRLLSCEVCGVHLKGAFITCEKCFKPPKKSYDLCYGCYGDKHFKHHHDSLRDNYELLPRGRSSTTGKVRKFALTLSLMLHVRELADFAADTCNMM